jgi:hypothetical protein
MDTNNRTALLREKAINFLKYLELASIKYPENKKIKALHGTWENVLKEKDSLIMFIELALLRFWDGNVFDTKALQRALFENSADIVREITSDVSSYNAEERDLLVRALEESDLPEDVLVKVVAYFSCFCDIYSMPHVMATVVL